MYTLFQRLPFVLRFVAVVSLMFGIVACQELALPLIG